MAENVITDNTPTPWLVVLETPVHVILPSSSVFDTVSIALEQEINDAAEPVLDVSDVAIAYTAAKDDSLNFQVGDIIRLNPSSAGASTNVPWKVSGVQIRR